MKCFTGLILAALLAAMLNEMALAQNDDADDTGGNKSTVTNSNGGGEEEEISIMLSVDKLLVFAGFSDDRCIQVVRNCMEDGTMHASSCDDYKEYSTCANDSLLTGKTNVGWVDGWMARNLGCRKVYNNAINLFCFGVRMVSRTQQENVTISSVCEKRVADVSTSGTYYGDKDSSTCHFFTESKKYLMEEINGDVCSEKEVLQITSVDCLACRSAMTSLVLLVALVPAQLLLTWV